MTSPPSSPSHPLRPWLGGERFAATLLWIALVMAASLGTRLALLLKARPDVDTSLGPLAGVFLCGALFDLAFATASAIPLHLYLWMAPRRWLAGRVHRWLIGAVFFVALYVLLFVTVAEWLFWDEFSARFNFIAVDYLVYTTEVIGNIRESYPLPAILVGVAAIAGLGLFALRRLAPRLRPAFAPAASGLAPSRTGPAIAGLALPLALQLTLSNHGVPDFGNAFNQELARNGPFSFFAAYWENELRYDQFYPTVPASTALLQLRAQLTETNATFVSPAAEDIRRRIVNPGPERRWNIVQITVESLSARFLGHFGNNKGLTPNLDRLCREGIVFTNLYATGTRTVRGMEALSLCVPPTPGQSIVRRPNNSHLFTFGSLLRSRGYDTAFLYSGYGYFDNMNAFFAGNGYRVIDRSSVAASDITHATSWGACDEDLYRWTIREADAAHAAGRPFHHFVMTTSNHRPFTFPTGRVDRPQGHRQGAIAYTDYAIGRFVDEARRRPWFTNTLFLFVADHCASAAGKTALPVEGYHIPAILWNPALVAPREIDTLCSQIDLPPTILGLMNWSYETQFHGKDVLKLRPEDGRAYISTYQKLGRLTPGHLAVLEPVRRQQSLAPDPITGEWKAVTAGDTFTAAAIAAYESASHLFTHRADAHADSPPGLTRSPSAETAARSGRIPAPTPAPATSP